MSEITIEQLPPAISVIGGSLDGQKIHCAKQGFISESREVYMLNEITIHGTGMPQQELVFAFTGKTFPVGKSWNFAMEAETK